MSIADKLTTIAENQQKVYEAGKQAEYDRFWDSFIPDGKTDFYYAFGGRGWSASTFRPNKDLKPINAAGMFFYWDGNKIDLKSHLETLGIELDFSQATNTQSVFNTNTAITRLGIIDLSKSTNVGSLLYQCFNLTEVEKIVLPTNPNVSWTNAYNYCYELTTITFEGKYYQSFDIRWSKKLTHDSLMSAINALYDYSADTSGKTYTLTIGATNLAKLTDAEKAIATQKGWSLA